MKIGFIGLGVMGRGMALNLLRHGFEVAVYARRPAMAAPHAQAGARVAADLTDLARSVDVVILSLPDTPDVRSVLFDAGGIAETLPAGGVVIDTSTISAAAAREFARSLRARGIAFLDAPVSGGQKGADEGTLTCMVGGDEEVFARCRHVLEGFARTITHVGEVGAGQLCKSCNQICVIASMLGAAEMVALCLRAGVDPAKVRQALLGGSANSTVMQNHTLRLIDHAFTPGFRAELLLKDLRIALDALRAHSVFAPVTALAEPIFSALVQGGRGGLDWSAVGMVTQELSGVAGDRKEAHIPPP
jgi:2-hydroxy-3-oxopropionate reductase